MTAPLAPPWARPAHSFTRALTSTQFTETLDVLEEYCTHRGYRHLRLDGATNRIRRELDVRSFNAPGSPLFLYLISTRAGGMGINLHTADSVVLFDSCYNPQVQCRARERGRGMRREGRQ